MQDKAIDNALLALRKQIIEITIFYGTVLDPNSKRSEQVMLAIGTLQDVDTGESGLVPIKVPVSGALHTETKKNT